MISITKKFNFCYGHHLPDHEGKCRNIHGHNAVLEVTVTGTLQACGPSHGMIIDFNEMKEIVETNIIDKFDHQFLNSLIPNLSDAPPTAEVIVFYTAGVLFRKFEKKGVRLIRVRMYETPDSYAEWTE